MRRPLYGFNMLTLVTETHTKNQEHPPFKFIINSVFPPFLKRSLYAYGTRQPGPLLQNLGGECTDWASAT